MTILHVPVTATNQAEWTRRGAYAINQLIVEIGNLQPLDEQLTSLAALDWTGNAGYVIAVNATEDGFELVAGGGGGGTTTQAITFNNGGSGDASGVSFNGSTARTISYNTVGAAASSHGHAYTEINSVPTATVFYRKTAGTGAAETQTLATLKTDLGLTGTNSGDQTITLTGDVTGSGTGSFAATIPSNTVTYAKMQDVSATSRILGRKTAGSGDPEECTLSEVLDFVGSAAQGDILYRGSSNWTRLGAGTSGQVLKTQGAAANPAWANPGLVYAQPSGSPGSNDAGAFATLTNAFVLAESVDVYALYGMFNAANTGDVYNMFIATVDNSGNISATVATGSSSYTTVATGIHFRKFSLSSPVTLSAGTNYILALVLTNRTTTTACRAYLSSGTYLALPEDFAAMTSNLGAVTKRFWYTQTSSSPSSGAPASSSTSSTQYQLGLGVKLG